MGDADGAGAFQQAPQHVGSGGGVFQGAVDRRGGGEEVGSERAEAEVAHLGGEQAAGEAQGVESAVGEPPVSVRLCRRLEESHVVADVVPDDHRLADEFDQ